MTHLLIDYQGFIVAFLTHLLAPTTNCSSEFLEKNLRLLILGNSNVVAGIKSPRTKGEKLFDQISRKEQVAVENVHAWIKNAKNTNFRSSPNKLVLSVFIVYAQLAIRFKMINS